MAAHLSSYPQVDAVDAVTQTLQTLVLSLVSSAKVHLTPAALARFVVSLSASLPSSSAQDPRPTFNAILLDVIWTVDVGLEDALPSHEKKIDLPVDVRETFDADKQTLAAFVKELVVSTSMHRIIPHARCLTYA